VAEVRCLTRADLFESEERPELLDGETGILDDSTQRNRVDRIVTRDDKLSRAVSQNDVLALSQYLIAGLPQSPHRIKVIDTGQHGHL